MLIRNTVNPLSLQSLVEIAIHKYQAMEKSRIDLSNIPLLNLVASDVRTSKLNKLTNLLENQKSEIEIANAILELQKEEQLGVKLKAIVDVLAICAITLVEKNNFENAKERLALFKKMSFEQSPVVYDANDKNADAYKAFNFTKAFQEIFVTQCLDFIRKVEKDSKKIIEEKHTHPAPQPATPITPAFIQAEKSKKIAQQNQIIEALSDALYNMKRVAVHNRKREVKALEIIKDLNFQLREFSKDLQIANAEILKQDKIIDEMSDELTSSEKRVKSITRQLNFFKITAEYDKAQLRVEKFREKLQALEKTKAIIMRQGAEISALDKTLAELSGELEAAERQISHYARALAASQDRVRQLSSSSLFIDNVELTTQLMHEQHLHQMSKQENIDLRIKNIWERKAALDKAKEIIIRQGRELNSYRGFDTPAALRNSLFNQTQVAETQTDFQETSHKRRRM